jgi:hypothetical protein
MCRNSFLCLLVNLNPTEQTLKHFPQTQELLKLNGQFQSVGKCELSKGNKELQSQLRLAHYQGRRRY